MIDTGATGLIVSANQVVTPYPVYPLGAACLVTALKNQGHQVDHFDVLADGGLDGLKKLLVTKAFDFIGVSIRNLDTVDSAAPNQFLAEIVETVELIRATQKSTIILGGPAFSILPEKLMELLGADYGVVGEGESLLPWLARELVAGRRPEKKIFYSEPTIGLWQPSDLTKSTAEYYIKHGGMLNVQTKRGCPHACGYCSYPNIEGRKIRYRDPDEVADEVIHLRDHSGARYIFFADSYFNDHEGRFLKIAEALIRKKSEIPWCAFFRPENLERSELRLLKKSGLAAVELGTDAACDTTLKGIGKSFSFKDVLKVHENVVREEIPLAHFIMFGGPEEDDATVAEGLENIELLDKSVVFAFAGIRILPDTAIYDRALLEGVVKSEDSLLEPVFYFSPKTTKEKIIAAIRESFGMRTDRIYPCHEFEARIAALHGMGLVGPLWDFALKKRKYR